MKRSLIKVCTILFFILLLFECSSARRRTASRQRNKNSGSGSSDSSSSSSRDSSSTQQKSESKTSAGSYPGQNVADSKPYTPTQKVADVKPSAPVEVPIARKETSIMQQSNSNTQTSSAGWSIPGQTQNNFKTIGGSQQSKLNPGSSTGWSNSGSKSNPQLGTDNLSRQSGWTPGYQTSGAQQNNLNTKSASQLSQSNFQASSVGSNNPGFKSNAAQSTDNVSYKGGWTSGYQTSGNQQNNFNTKGGSQLPNSNLQSSSTGWNNPGYKSRTDNQQYQRGGWTSGYQSSGNQRGETSVKKETSKVQQSSPNQPQPPQPGWNVPGQNNAPGANAGGWKSGYQTHGAPPAYPHQNAAPPSYNGQSSWGAPPAYPGHAPGGYGGFGNNAPGGYGGVGHSAPGGYGGYGHGYSQPGGYGGYGGHPSSVGGYNPGYGGMSTAGMGMAGMGMGGGGYGSGGFGGGYGGYGGYPMKKKSFFSASTIGSVVAGMLVYNMASSLISHGLGTKRPYTVVNYYNQEPNKTVEEIKLPANVLMLCDGNSTQLCGQGTQSVCTQNGTILCVATMNQAAPCDQGGNHALCVNTTVPCVDANDPICQNSTKKDKLEVDVNVPCFTNLTLDVNLVDKSQTLPNTKYTYCVTTMAIAGPEYNICEELIDTNDYRSVLNGNSIWFLETDGFRRNYSIYNYDRPMETNGEINMPVTVLIKCSDNAIKLCAPGTVPTCTTFNEIMCMASLADIEACSERNSTCVKSTIPCSEGSTEKLCQNKTEGADTAALELPCFANVTINAPIPKFNLVEFNGTLPDLATTTSYTYHFNYCVVALALPGSDFDLCITKEAKEKQDKQQGKS